MCGIILQGFQNCAGFLLDLLSYNIFTTLVTYPDLVQPFGVDVDPGTRTECLLLWILIFGVGDGELSVYYQVGRETMMSMGRVVSTRAVGPGEDVLEACTFEFSYSLA
jgi:hypothetical protein